MKFNLKIALGVTLVGYTFGFLGLHVLAQDKDFSPLENRTLTPVPIFSTSSFVNGSFGKTFESYIADQFPYRDNFISIKAYSELALQKKDNNGVYIGKDDYFLQNFDSPNFDVIQKNANYLNAFAENFNVSMLLAPTSTKVHADKLPPYATSYDDALYINSLYDKLSDKINKVNVLDTLLAKNKEYIYYKTDHHWTSLGAYYAYTTWAESVGIKPLALSDFNIKEVSNSFYGSLFSKGNFTFATPDTVSIFESKKPVDVTVNYVNDNKVVNSLYNFDYLKEKDHYSIFLDSNHPLITVKTSVNNDKKLLVIKDSYANSMIPFLIHHYEEIHIMDLRFLNMPITTYAHQNGIKDVLFIYNTQGFNTEVKYSLLNR